MSSVNFTLRRSTLCGSLVVLGLYVFGQPVLSQEGKVAPAGPRVPPLHRTLGGNWLAMSHNAAVTVEMELVSNDVVSALAKAAGLPQPALTEVRFSVRESFGFIMTSTNLFKPEAEKLFEVAAAYVTCRAEGHTKVFALATIEERVRRSAEENDDYYRKHLFSVFPYLPRSWVKPFKRPEDTGKLYKRFIVIDDSLAWVYLVPIAHGRVQEFRADAQEYDERHDEKFEAAKNEAIGILRARNISENTRGSGQFIQREMKRILEAKYQIKWRTYSELNPNLPGH